MPYPEGMNSEGFTSAARTSLEVLGDYAGFEPEGSTEEPGSSAAAVFTDTSTGTRFRVTVTPEPPAPVADSVELAHVADAIDRVGGDASDYDATADMAARMLARFPAVAWVAAEYVRGNEDKATLDYTVSEALAAF